VNASSRRADRQPFRGFCGSLPTRTVTDEAISTGCSPVDELLGGGSNAEPSRSSCWICRPAAGKTALSAAVETAVDGGTVSDIDTEVVSVDRFQQLLEATVDTGVASRRGWGVFSRTVEAVASRIVIEDALFFEEQAEAVRDAEEFAERADLIVPTAQPDSTASERTADGDEGSKGAASPDR